MKRRTALWLPLLGCAHFGAHALGATGPEGWVLRGQGLYRYWGFEVYRARLWTPADFQVQDPTATGFALELEYLRDFKGQAIAERSIDEMRRVARFSDTQAQRWRAQMTALFPDVAPGHTLRGTHRPGLGAVFEHNGRALGEISDGAFAQAFFGIWLSPQTSGPQLREALLGAGRAGA